MIKLITKRGEISSMLEMLPPFALRVAATLRLSDHMSDGTCTLGELAQASGASPDALGRLLRYLACLGVYQESEVDRFAPTAAGRMLAERHPAGLRQWLDFDAAGGRMDLALGGLLHSIRTGRSGYEAVFQHSFWDDLAADPARAASFDTLMAAKSSRVAPQLAALDWTGVGRLADVGGGAGLTLIELLSAHPHLHGVLVEQPAVIDRARQALAEAGLADRCEVADASFLDGVPEGADAYLLFDVLHNWDDEVALDILRRCCAAAAESGRVFIVEELPTSSDDRNGRAMDLKMLVLFGGRQRSASEFGELATKAGLAVVHVHQLPCGFSVVECGVSAWAGMCL